jgi:hypothetical protein
MLSLREFKGGFKQAEHPQWQPLLDVAEELVEQFMWMEEIELETGLRLQLYKHCLTRRYIHLDGEGRAWAFRGDGGYQLRYLSVELRHVLDEWWESDIYKAKPEEVATYLRVIERTRQIDLGEMDVGEEVS